jgi:hypothetical protein
MPGGLLLHPSFMFAVCLLLVNDHVIKPTLPGMVSGKLSDFAGLFFFPPLLVSVAELVVPRWTPRRRAGLLGCAVATGIAFSLVQLWPPATNAYAVGLGALQWVPRWLLTLGKHTALHSTHVTPDAWDLIALPACFGALLTGRRN